MKQIEHIPDYDDLVIGVLALQGAFLEHVRAFEKVGVKAVEIRSPSDFDAVSGIVIPGGESTTIVMLARRWGLFDKLQQWVRDGKPVWGTCAGMILLADSLTGKMKAGQETIGGLRASVHRNYFGSQLGSFSAELNLRDELDWPKPLQEGSNCTNGNLRKRLYRGIFIRAPVLVDCHKDVQVLATVKPVKASDEACENIDDNDAIVAAKQGNILVTSFHPELTDDGTWHEYFYSICCEGIARESDDNEN